MNNQIIYNQLIEFGLDEVEAKIYLYLLEFGPRTPLKLSREVNVNRSKIYRYIEKMMMKSLIEETNDTWGKKLKASRPENLQLFIAKKEAELNKEIEIVPQLINNLLHFSSKSKSTFEIIHYKGIEGSKQMLWNRLSAKKEFLLFGNETMNNIVGRMFAEKIRTEQVNRRIKQYELENATDQGIYLYTDVHNWKKYYEARHIPPKSLKIQHYISIFDDTVSIMNWENDEHAGIEIINTALAEMQRQIFWKFWKIAEKKK